MTSESIPPGILSARDLVAQKSQCVRTRRRFGLHAPPDSSAALTTGCGEQEEHEGVPVEPPQLAVVELGHVPFEEAQHLVGVGPHVLLHLSKHLLNPLTAHPSQQLGVLLPNLIEL